MILLTSLCCSPGTLSQTDSDEQIESLLAFFELLRSGRPPDRVAKLRQMSASQFQHVDGKYLEKEKLGIGRGMLKKAHSEGMSDSYDEPGQRQCIQRKAGRHIFWKSLTLLFVIVAFHYAYFANPSRLAFRGSRHSATHPHLHFATAKNWRGGPNGVFIDADETWHMYFQCECSLRYMGRSNTVLDEPTDSRSEDCQGWEHATSHDLYAWTTHAVALHCDDYGISSGSIVVDKNNTSGFFPDQTDGVVAIYTQHHLASKIGRPGIAYSRDGGYSFNNDAGDRLELISPDEDVRDPKVIWHEPTQRWVMVVAKKASTVIGIYTSTNLRGWVLASDFTSRGFVGAGYRFESPNLVPIPRLNSTGAKVPNYPTTPGGQVLDFGDYILLVSSTREGSRNGGSKTRYVPGKFNGTHFDPIDGRFDRLADFGPDNQASQFFFGLPDYAPVVSLSLASNLQQAESMRIGSRERHGGMLTGPREGYLIAGPGEGDLSYFSHPVNLDSLRSKTLANVTLDRVVDRPIPFSDSKAVLLEAQFVMQPPDDNPVEINLDFTFKASSGSEQIPCTIIFRTWTADLGCDRSRVTLNRTLTNPVLDQMSVKQVRPLLPFHNPAVRRWEVQAILDGSILEIYLNKGVKAGTITMLPSSPLDTVNLKTGEIPAWANLNVKVEELAAGRS